MAFVVYVSMAVFLATARILRMPVLLLPLVLVVFSLVLLRLGVLFLLCRFRLLLLLRRLGVLFLLGWLRLFLLSWLCLLLLFGLGFLFVVLFLRKRRNSCPEKKEYDRCADDSECFHRYCLRYYEFMRREWIVWSGMLMRFNDAQRVPGCFGSRFSRAPTF